MKILDHYIGVRLLQGYLLVMLVLLPLFSFLDIVEQLDDVGTGSYQLLDAFVFVGLMLPRRMLDLLPIIALLGSSVALGWLANSNELLAMQATGVSILRLGWSIMKTGVLLMLLAAGLEEFVASPVQQYALQQRSLAISGSKAVRTQYGFWFHHGPQYINIRNVHDRRAPAEMDIYEFTQHGQLRSFTHAGEVDTSIPEQWLLLNVTQKTIKKGDIRSDHVPSMHWESTLTPSQVDLVGLPIESLSPSELYHYIAYLRTSGQKANRYELMFWQKLVLPPVTGAMVLLSTSFVFGWLRSASTGKRIILGSVVGIAFYLGNQIMANAGLLLDLNPLLTALIPLLVISALCGIGVKTRLAVGR